MKATVIVDNKGKGKLRGEWGLCILIETGTDKVLLDIGASDLFIDNAKELGLDLSNVNHAVLSHAHYDHGNGIEAFFKINNKARLYVGKECAPNCYIRKWIFNKYIGIPKNVMEKYPDRFLNVGEKTMVCDNVFIVPHNTPGLDQIGVREKMYVRKDHRWLPDDFSHEHSLVVKTDSGLVIFNSCSHAGTLNIINETAEAFPGEHISAYIGGFHLFNKQEGEIRQAARKLKETGVGYICTGHCTGDVALGILHEELGDALHVLHCGLVIDIA